MLNQELITSLNSQINKEFYSSYIYLDMSNYYINKNLNGFGNWFKIQAMEEKDHAMLFLTYLQNNGEVPVLDAIDKPTLEYKSFVDPLVEALKHEQYVTASINDIYSIAISQKDFRTMQFLDWFIKEQGEEEKNTDDLIKRYELFGTDAKGLYMLDAELAARIYTPPSLVL